MGVEKSWSLTDLEWDVVVHNAPLVMHLLKRRGLNQHDADDAIQYGIIGLARGVSLCDAEKGTLATFAARHVCQAVRIGLRRSRARIQVSRRQVEEARGGRRREQAERVLSAEFVPADPERLGAPEGPDPVEAADTAAAIRAALAFLPEVERDAVEGLLAGETPVMTARRSGVTRQAVDYRIRRAKDRLREILAPKLGYDGRKEAS